MVLHNTGVEHTFVSGIIPATGNYTYSYNTTTHVATLAFSSLIPRDLYRIDIVAAAVVGIAGHLDGIWDNATGGTPYNYLDDFAALPTGHTLPSGNGNGGKDFQFMFALNPGDYNQDHVVNGGDYVMWNNGEADGDGDGDGDGIGDAGDYTVWSNNYNAYLQFRKWQGDFNRDGAVNGLDWSIWRMQFGITNQDGLAADADDDDDVDGGDYTMYANYRNTYTAWYMSTP